MALSGGFRLEAGGSEPLPRASRQLHQIAREQRDRHRLGGGRSCRLSPSADVAAATGAAAATAAAGDLPGAGALAEWCCRVSGRQVASLVPTATSPPLPCPFVCPSVTQQRASNVARACARRQSLSYGTGRRTSRRAGGPAARSGPVPAPPALAQRRPPPAALCQPGASSVLGCLSLALVASAAPAAVAA